MASNFNVKAFLASLTHAPGIYQMLDEHRKIIYVGKARDLKKRVSSYFSGKTQDIKTQALLKHVKDIDITVTHTENDALLLECNLIKKHKPHYNVLFRDDKSYPYIIITNEHPYPRIDFYRGARKKDGLYFGPFPNTTAVRETIHIIQKLFGIRTCSDNFFSGRTRACLHHQIGLCSGSCAGLIDKNEYMADVKHAILFLQGKNDEIIRELQNQMQQAASARSFELAARLRDQITRLREIQQKQYISSDHGNADVIGYAYTAGVACIQLLSIREGRVLGSRAYFPMVPANASLQEILSSFITQHYLVNLQDNQAIPKEIIFDVSLQDEAMIADTLSEQAKHKVMLLHKVRTERKKWLDMAMLSAQQSIATQLLNKVHTQERFQALQAVLHLKKLPTRIECFDISHTLGEETVASCVVFNSQGPVKNDYRRFNINGITPGDDPAAIYQAVQRRYQRKEESKEPRSKSDLSKSYPDIILIDGGVAQLNAAENALQPLLRDLSISTPSSRAPGVVPRLVRGIQSSLQLDPADKPRDDISFVKNVLLIGIAKGAARKPGFEILHFLDRKPMQLPPDSLALHLIQQIRDEAHRFALIGHRHKRDKKRHTSVLESIPGIGASRRRELLRYFGGIQAINHASLEELLKVPGINRSIAQKIFEFFNKG